MEVEKEKVSSKNEEQPGASRAAVSEVPKAQSSVPSQPGPLIGSSEEASELPEADDEDDEVGDEEDEASEDEGDDEGGEDEEEEEGDEDGEEEDDGSLLCENEQDTDEYQDELWAVAGKKSTDVKTLSTRSTSDKDSNDKEVSELLEFKRRKKGSIVENGKATKDKRVPTVKKELSTQKEILIGDNETQVQSSHRDHISMSDRVPDIPKTNIEEVENEDGSGELLSDPNFDHAYTVLRAGEVLKKLNKRQSDLLRNFKAYLANDQLAQQEKLQSLGLHFEGGSSIENFLKLLAKLAENPERWERVHRLLKDIKADLDYSRQAVEAQKRLVQVANPFIREVTQTLTTSLPSPTSDRPTKKPKKKKKKKKKLRQQKLDGLSTPTATTTMATTTFTSMPEAIMTIGTTDTPWSTTQSSAATKWRLVAERLFGPSWIQDDLQDDDSNVAKVRYSIPSKPRTMSSVRRPLDDKERESLKALNSERQALMLKAAREYSQPRLLHFGKINTHQQTSTEDLEDGYETNQRAYQRTHFGQLVSPSTGGYVRPRDPPNPQHEQSTHFDISFARNQAYLPPGREFAASKPWEAGTAYGYETPWGKLAEPPNASWNRFQFSKLPKSWLPWETERDYFNRMEEEEKAAKAAWQQRQNWNIPNLRGNLPPWLEEKDVNRVLQSQNSWPKSEKSRDYAMHRTENNENWDNSRSNNNNNNNNNSELKSIDETKLEEESKESPKLTMKTWNSLTSDPATWPFKLPGAKPWPKDENGKSYNPNAELVRKLGRYKNGRLRSSNDLKQEKNQKSDKIEDTWGDKGSSAKMNNWIEPVEEQQYRYFEDVDTANNNGRMWSREKLPEEWKQTSTWPNKWKQFAYHKVTAQPTSKSGVSLDKPGKNAFIAVSAVSSPRYGNEWRKNDIEEIGQLGSSITDDLDHPASQIRMKVWKKSEGANGTINLQDKTPRIDVLENQLENLKEKDQPVLLEVNVSIRNSSSHETPTSSPSTTSSSSSSSTLIIEKSNVTVSNNTGNSTARGNQRSTV